MQKKFRLSAAAFLLVAVFILPGCTKLFDYFEDHPGSVPLCSIHRLISPGFESGVSDTVTFTYNRDGSPHSVIHTARVGDFVDNWLFHYDKRGRLIQAFGYFDPANIVNGEFTGQGELLHSYAYDIWGRVVTDTMYVGPFFANGQLILAHGGSQLYTLEYDSKDRVSREGLYEYYFDTKTKSFEGYRDYSYNAQGNWVRPGSPEWVYDDKINLNRTNKVWMMFNRDYSVNNGFIADSYNKFGLPVVKTTPISDHPFLFNDLPSCTIEYDCP